MREGRPARYIVFACKYLEVSAAPIVAQRMIRCGWVDKTEALCARC
jgi:hypothetical protein